MNTEALTIYREAFERTAASYPPPQRLRRQQMLERFLEQGFPEKHEEDWKYTDLSSLASTRFWPAGYSEEFGRGSPPRLSNTRRITFVNGYYDAETSDADRPPSLTNQPDPAHDGVSALNAALANDGLNFHLAAGERTDPPLHVLIHHDGDAPVMAHLRHCIALEKGADAEIILHFTGTGRYFTTQFFDIRLGAGAHLKLYRIQDDSEDATALVRTDVHIGRDASLQAELIELGGHLVRHDFVAHLDEPGAEAVLNGLYVPVGDSHIDTHTRIEHHAPHGRSRELFRGIAAGHGHGVYDGLVVVAKNAIKTDSGQQVANLLLSPTAEMNAKPELEIYNDDVRCSHGAATGALDDSALFYLQSRGIGRVAAKRLLTYGFASAALQQIHFSDLRELINKRLDSRLRAAIGEE